MPRVPSFKFSNSWEGRRAYAVFSDGKSVKQALSPQRQRKTLFQRQHTHCSSDLFSNAAPPPALGAQAASPPAYCSKPVHPRAPSGTLQIALPPRPHSGTRTCFTPSHVAHSVSPASSSWTLPLELILPRPRGLPSVCGARHSSRHPCASPPHSNSGLGTGVCPHCSSQDEIFPREGDTGLAASRSRLVPNVLLPVSTCKMTRK